MMPRTMREKSAGAASLFLTLLLLGPGGCSTAAPKPAAPACEPIAGLAPLLKPGAVLLVGEMHGTAESPAFLANAACLALAAGRAVTLALEIPREEQDRIAAYLASEGRDDDRAELLNGPFWQDPYQDGRRSRAMLSLLEEVHALRRAARPIQVILLDSTEKTSGQERDRAMAKRLKAAVDSSPGDLFLVLTGNLHTRVARGVPWDQDYEPMGFVLSQLAPDLPITALDMASTGGTAWFCDGAEATTCGPKPLGGKGDGNGRRVQLHDQVSPQGYSGVYQVGTLSASPPAAKRP